MSGDRLAGLRDALEAGLDLPGTLAAACRSAGAEAAYVLSDGGGELVLAAGAGPQRLPAPAATGPEAAGDRTLVPMISGRRLVGALALAGSPAPAPLEDARTVAAFAAQAVETARLWESGGLGSGSLDALTGLPNHRGLASVLARELARAKRTGTSLAVAVVDVDGMRRLNEQRGEAEGDRAVRLAADCFARGVRSYDCVCRVGGDEFALILPGIEASTAATLLSRLAASFAEAAGLTVSGGVASFPRHGGTQAELAPMAGAALRRARAEGGGRIVVFDAAADELEGGDGPRLRGLDPTVGAAARAAGEYAGLLAGALGLDTERVERMRLAALAGAADVDRRVAAGALDAEAAGWLAARGGGADRPLEARVLEVAERFVEAGGATSSAGAGRALAALLNDERADRQVVAALERLLADAGEA